MDRSHFHAEAQVFGVAKPTLDIPWDRPLIGGSWSERYDRSGTLLAGESRMEWTLRLVGTEIDGQSRSCEVMVLSRPDGLGDIATLGLTLAESKQLLVQVQQEVVAAQARRHTLFRPDCQSCSGRCHMKGWQPHRIATLFGEVRVKLPRLACAGGGCGEAGGGWPSHCRSTPELDQLQARLSALMPYRVAADVMQHLLPIDAGTSPRHCAAIRYRSACGSAMRRQRSRRPPPRPSRSVWIQPSYAAAKTANAIWRSASATSRRLMVAARSLAPSPGPKPASPR